MVMILDTKNKNMYGLGKGISTVFEMHFLSQGYRNTPYGHDLQNIKLSPDTRIKDTYGLGVRISTVCEILRHSLFKGGQDNPVWL
jgi:hypothetical protein